MYFELHVQKLCFCNQFGVILHLFFFLFSWVCISSNGGSSLSYAANHEMDCKS